MKIHHFLLSLFFILPFSSYSQFPSITLADPSFQYQIIQEGQEGLLLYSETKTDDKKNIKMMFELYDSNFVRKASKSTMRSEAMNTALEFYSTANKAYYILSNDFFKIDRLVVFKNPKKIHAI